MDTVDKDWLKEKVRSGGVINVTRAMYAAQQMLDGKRYFEAVKTSRAQVADKAPDLPNALARTCDPMVRNFTSRSSDKRLSL